MLATWKLGAVPVPVRWDLPDWECERVLQVIDAAIDVGPDDLAWLAATIDGPDDLVSDAVSPQTHGICSSGSTGTPKVIVIERPARWEPVEPFVSGWIDVPTPQIVLVAAPLYHTNGFATLASLLAGDRLVLLERFDAGRLVDLVERHGVTTFTATPTMLSRIADRARRATTATSVRWCGCSKVAAAIAPSLVRRWIDLLGAERFFMAYGMTEGLGLAAMRGDEWLLHPGSVGRGYRDTEIRILDPEHHDLPPDEIGEIFLRWPAGAMYAYLGGASRLAVTADGFASAGDLGFLDADGFLHIVDRRSDLIISGGANVYPAEVESALIDHDAIADVVVIGLTDPEWGRRVHAIVEPRDPATPSVGGRRDRLREIPARPVQGAQDRRVRRPDPPQRRHEGEPTSSRRGAGVMSPRRPGRGRGGLAGQLRPSCASMTSERNRSRPAMAPLVLAQGFTNTRCTPAATYLSTSSVVAMSPPVVTSIGVERPSRRCISAMRATDAGI